MKRNIKRSSCRQLISAVLALALIAGLLLNVVALSPTPVVPDPGFSDVAASAWYYPYVGLAKDAGLMQGVGEGRFAPNAAVTRAMFVTVLYRLSEDVEVHNHFTDYERPFDDVPENSYYAEAALWAGIHNIVKGTTEGVFAPQRPLTREQAATILSRFLTYMEYQEEDDWEPFSYEDAKEISLWARYSVYRMRRLGIMEGDEQGLFRPKASLNRAQCAKLVIMAQRTAASCFRPEPVRAEELSKGFSGRYAPGQELSEEQRRAITDFSVALFCAAADGTETRVLSPASALYALAMTANGARGQTLAELETAFGLPLDQLNPALANWKNRLCYESGPCVMGNSIWISQNNRFRVPDAFLQTNADYYGAQVYRIPFDDEGIRALNTWVSNYTRGKIDRLLDRFDMDQGLALVNTILLAADWERPYEVDREGIFTKADGQTTPCRMLDSVESRYLEDERFTGFVKPLLKGYAFVGLLPKSDLSAALSGWTGEDLTQLLDSAARTYEVHASMPVLDLSCGGELAEAMRKLGVRDLFVGADADLSGMGGDQSNKLHVSSVIQKTRFMVNKNGVEAAAATVVVVIPESAETPEQQVRVVKLDRPYLCLVLDTRTGLPLFIGAVTDPTA